MAGLSVPLDEVVHFDVVTHDPGTGGEITATSPTYDIFEEATDTAILSNQTLTERAGETGIFRGTFTASAANGFDLGKYYSCIAEATAGGVTAHAVALSFRIAAAESVAGVPEVDVTHTVGGLVPTPATTGIPDVNVRKWLDTDCATPTVAGVPETDLTHVMGTILTEGGAGRLAAAIVKLFDVATPTLVASDVMRGTDSAALASVVGALNDAAVDGDPTTGDTVMQYVKQLINVLVGTTGAVTFPAEQAPANNINLLEVLRAIHTDVTGLNGDAMVGTDSAALAADYTSARAGYLDNLNISENVAGTSEVGHLILASGTSDSGDSTSMVDAARTEATTDHWNDKMIVFGAGGSALNVGHCGLITGFTPGSDTVTFAPAAPASITTETYKIIPWAKVDLLAATQTSIDAIETDTNSLNDTKIPDTISLANINAEVDTALTTTTYAEPGQGAPAATASIQAKIGYVYKAWRNRSNQDATTYQLFNDDATTVDQKATVSDNSTIAEKGEVATGA